MLHIIHRGGKPFQRVVDFHHICKGTPELEGGKKKVDGGVWVQGERERRLTD